jgi:hypothetical protein
MPDVIAGVVDTFEPTPGTRELVGYYCLRDGTTTPDPAAISCHLRERLPSYMVPAYLEHLAAIPMTPQQTVDRRALPAPGDRLVGAAAVEHVAGEPMPAPEVTPVADPTTPVRRTRTSTRPLLGGIPDLLAYLVVMVSAIVWLVLEQGFDWLSDGVGRLGMVEIVPVLLTAAALAGLLCVLVPLARRLMRGSR